MKKIGVYMRVSTDKQKVDSQKLEIEKYLSKLYPEPENVEWFEDVGVSGSVHPYQRAGYRDLMEATVKRRIDTVLVHRLDRLSRRSLDALEEVIKYDKMGIEFICAMQPYISLNNKNPFARTMVTVFADVTEMERNLIRDRVVAGLNAAKARGVVLGRPKLLTEEKIDEILSLRSMKLPYRKIAEATGLSIGSICKLCKMHPNLV